MYKTPTRLKKLTGYSCRITTSEQSSSSAEHISPWESSITLLARPGSRVAIWTFRDDNNRWTHYFFESWRGWCKALVAALEKLEQVALEYQNFFPNGAVSSFVSTSPVSSSSYSTSLSCLYNYHKYDPFCLTARNTIKNTIFFYLKLVLTQRLGLPLISAAITTHTACIGSVVITFFITLSFWLHWYDRFLLGDL